MTVPFATARFARPFGEECHRMRITDPSVGQHHAGAHSELGPGSSWTQ
jgi:hypothetical protein